MSLNSEDRTYLKSFYQALEDRPLDYDDQAYVHYMEEQSTDRIADMAAGIEFSRGSSVHLLTGQRGNGKSTELRRLKYLLEQQGCLVLLSDMRDYLNMTEPVALTDFIISLMGALSQCAEPYLRESPIAEGYWKRLQNFLQSEVTADSVVLKPSEYVEFQLSLKENASFKQKLQQALSSSSARLLKDAHDFALELVSVLRKQQTSKDCKIVFLVDSVEQIRGIGSEKDQSVYDSVRGLFVGHADQLQFAALHVVYTVPPYLIPLAPGVGKLYGGAATVNLPSIHVRKRDGREDISGIQTMEKVLTQRVPDWGKLLTKEQMARLALASGGDIRDFFRLLRQVLMPALRLDSLPVTEQLIDDAENTLRREMLPIADDDKKWLQRIAQSRSAELPDNQDLPILARFFDTHVVLNYRNGDDWYDVHPLLRKELGLNVQIDD